MKETKNIVDPGTPAETTTTTEVQATTEESSKKRKRLIILLLLLLALLGFGAFAAWNLLGQDDTVPEDASPVAVMPDIDANAEDITDREGLTDTMQEEADAAYFNLQVNPEATFSSEGVGTLELINPSNNVYPISFVITLDENGQELYRSGTVPPNKQVSTITLDSIPAVGSHKATVSVSIYNPDTQEKEGETQVKIDLEVTQ